MELKEENIFQVSVKGLHYNSEGKILMMLEDSGVWEFPGGRIERGEELLDALKRECMEEMGLVCEVLDDKPTIIYPSLDEFGRGRLLIFYKINFEHLNFRPTDECREIKFFSKEEMLTINLNFQLKKFPELL